ncbi:hypothetical protein B0H16DRAFT_1695548 [Mycena metata]|uniref:F-box domain-containing protein n=1 Tax=Mycena metata TaxID=1033252 RepID=A0AAD7I7I1_9AGAR|nr:hypothetical protein B0H16DRAFT_1695548 [Mycena metata]
MSSIGFLSEEVALLVCLELNVRDLLALRRVSRSFKQATYAKLLWMKLMELTVSEGHVLPANLGPLHTLEQIQLEALLVKVHRLWNRKAMEPVNSWRMNTKTHCPITWLRLVAGTWLFVASSDDEGYAEPIAEAYLPGPVETARLEHSNAHYFTELCRVEGSSHVLRLQGQFVGCALRNDAIASHIIDWTANTIYNLPPVPDSPETRCAPHLLVLWNDLIVVVRQTSLELYALPSETHGPIFIKSVPTIVIWEVVVIHPPSTTSVSPLRCPM